MTVCFLGEVDAPTRDRLSRFVVPQKCMVAQLCVSRAGWWRRPGVIWIAPEKPPSALLELNAALNDFVPGCGVTPEKRAYRPHVTVARGATRPPEPTRAFHLNWRTPELVLLESNADRPGRRYSVVHKWCRESGVAR